MNKNIIKQIKILNIGMLGMWIGFIFSDLIYHIRHLNPYLRAEALLYIEEGTYFLGWLMIKLSLFCIATIIFLLYLLINRGYFHKTNEVRK